MLRPLNKPEGISHARSTKSKGLACPFSWQTRGLVTTKNVLETLISAVFGNGLLRPQLTVEPRWCDECVCVLCVCVCMCVYMQLTTCMHMLCVVLSAGVQYTYARVRYVTNIRKYKHACICTDIDSKYISVFILSHAHTLMRCANRVRSSKI